MATTTTTALRETVERFCRCFELLRREDGSTYWAAKQGSRFWDDSFQGVIRELHDGELPNDWRYGEIVRIAGELLDQLQDAELAGDEVDSLIDLTDEISCEADCYRSELLQWLEIGDRWTAREENEIEPTADLFNLAQQLQAQERYWMAQTLAWELERLSSAGEAS